MAVELTETERGYLDLLGNSEVGMALRGVIDYFKDKFNQLTAQVEVSEIKDINILIHQARTSLKKLLKALTPHLSPEERAIEQQRTLQMADDIIFSLIQRQSGLDSRVVVLSERDRKFCNHLTELLESDAPVKWSY